MTNFEKYKEKILELEGDIALTNEGICECTGNVEMCCSKCLFNMGDFTGCDKKMFEWLYAEYDETKEKIEDLWQFVTDAINHYCRNFSGCEECLAKGLNVCDDTCGEAVVKFLRGQMEK